MAIEQLEGPGFTIELDRRPDHVRAVVRGSADSREVSVAYWHVLGEACRRHHSSAAMVLEDLPPFEAPDANDFEAVTDAMAAAGFTTIRCAFVDLREETEANEMGMLIGAEKGLECMIFSNESYAAHWLRFGSRSSSGHG